MLVATSLKFCVHTEKILIRIMLMYTTKNTCVSVDIWLLLPGWKPSNLLHLSHKVGHLWFNERKPQI